MVEPIRNLHIVMLIGFVSVVQMANDCPYTDLNCWCDDWGVKCKDLQEIFPLNMDANVMQLENVYFFEGNITSISKNSLPPGVKTIILASNPFTNISDNAFESSSATLTTVSIQEAKFTRLPSALEKLTALSSLQIQDTPIHDWNTALLKYLAETLTCIELKNVGLSAWPSWISDFRLLQKIDLNQNSLKSVPDDAFKLMKGSLGELDLCGTGLTHVPQALSTLSSLTILRLCNNNFTNESEFKRITEAPFAQKLSDLNLDTAGLTRIPNFTGLRHLNRISLTNNRIQEVPAGSLPASLTSVYISDNRLSCLPKDIPGMSRLENLYLSNNLITVIEPTPLPSSLTTLNLQFNKLTNITNTAFENLNNLYNLYLNSNPISTLASSAFADLKKLKVLGINDVHLTEIPMALTELSQETRVEFTTTMSLACPCPALSRLLDWFRSLRDPKEIKVSCSSGQTFRAYMKGLCKKP